MSSPRWTGVKPRSQPALTQSVGKSRDQLQERMNKEENHIPRTSVPYRLPRLSSSDGFMNSRRDVTNQNDKVWSRFGYQDADYVRAQNFGPKVWKVYVPSKSFLQQMRQSNLAVPKFREAMIIPSRSITKMSRSQNVDDNFCYKNLLRERSKHNIVEDTTVSHGSRAVSPSKSVRSLRWTLGSSNHPNFDAKGRSRIQGPYSREFTVTCMPPTNWLRMRLGRIPSPPTKHTRV